jgi:hypothetical protein
MMMTRPRSSLLPHCQPHTDSPLTTATPYHRNHRRLAQVVVARP